VKITNPDEAHWIETAAKKAVNILASRQDENFYSSLINEGEGIIPLPKAALQRRGFKKGEIKEMWRRWDVFIVAVIETLHDRNIPPDSLIPYE